MVLFLRNKRFNVMLFWADYYLRWWRLPIEERACRKTDLGGGDYYLRNTGLPPSFNITSLITVYPPPFPAQMHKLPSPLPGSLSTPLHPPPTGSYPRANSFIHFFLPILFQLIISLGINSLFLYSNILNRLNISFLLSLTPLIFPSTYSTFFLL